MNYTHLATGTVTAHSIEQWRIAFENSLRSTSPKDRQGGRSLMGPPPPPEERKHITFLVSPTTRHELAQWRQYVFPILQCPDVPDDEVWCCHMLAQEVAELVQDPEQQPISERWHRAWVIAGYPGAFGMDEVIRVFGHLHGAETAA